MPQNNGGNVTNLNEYRATSWDQKIDPSNLKSGDGGDRFDPMEARVSALEKAFERMDAKLDILIKDVAYLRGKVDAMPSTLQLLGFVVAIFVAAGVTRYFGH